MALSQCMQEKCSPNMRQDWVRSLWLSFPVSDFTLLVSLQILRLLFLGPWAGRSPDSTPQKKWAQPGASFSSFFPSTPFYLFVLTGTKQTLSVWKWLWWMHMRTLSVSKCAPAWCVGILDKQQKSANSFNLVEKQHTRGGRRTCSEKEDSHGAVVLSLCPPAEGNQGHQEGHQSCHSTGDQQHQGGNLPVCRARHTQVRAEHPNKSSIHRTALLNWTAVLTNTKQELIPQSEVSEAEWTAPQTSSTQATGTWVVSQ